MITLLSAPMLVGVVIQNGIFSVLYFIGGGCICLSSINVIYFNNLMFGNSLFLLQLSGGEKQRVALARAFLKAPAIL